MLERKTADVAIIGAGVAGLEAARVLREQRVDFVVLEARERIGGRIFTLHDDSLPIAIELGAEFVHGSAPEVSEVAHAARLGIVDIGGRRWQSVGTKLRPLDDFWSVIGGVMGRLRKRGADRSFEQFLKTKPGGARQARARTLALQFVEGFHAADPARISEHALADGGSPDDDVREQRIGRVLGGYDAIARWIARDVGDRIRFGAVVTRVNWEPGAVRIDVQDASGSSASAVEARAAIVALPLGVLQAPPSEPGAVVFDPPLDGQIASALGGMTMGAVVRVVLRLREPFWADERFARRMKSQNVDQLAFLHGDNDDFPVWWTSYPVSAPVLVAWCGGPDARDLGASSEDQITARAVTAFARQFKLTARGARQMVTGAWMHNWVTDPYSRGVYSYIVVDGNGSPAKMARPLKRTLFFAGEATDAEGRTGTVHGAIATGHRAAKQVLRAL